MEKQEKSKFGGGGGAGRYKVENVRAEDSGYIKA